jgi:hypothetical protein
MNGSYGPKLLCEERREYSMHMKKFILIILTLLPSLSFSQLSSDDTLKIVPNSIIFYSITQAEFDTLAMEGKDEVLSDFYWYSDKIIEKYWEDERFIKVMLTAHRHYLIKTNKEEVYFDRLEKDHIVGMIMVKDEGYEIIVGVWTDVGINPVIQNFFGF